MRVTVSLDSLDDAAFQTMNDIRFPVRKVLDAIDVARAAGIGPIKITMVVKKGQNDHEILAMARHFKGTPYILRFIEFVDVGSTNDWRLRIDPLQAAILAVGAAIPAPVQRLDELVDAPKMKITLTAGHRVLERAAAAAFLRGPTFSSGRCAFCCERRLPLRWPEGLIARSTIACNHLRPAGLAMSHCSEWWAAAPERGGSVRPNLRRIGGSVISR